MNEYFKNILKNQFYNKEEFSDLSELIEQAIDGRTNKVEKELQTGNDTYIYSLIKIETIKNYLAAENELNQKLMFQFEELETDIISILQSAMYIQGLKDGLNMLNLAAGNKIKVFGELL